MDKDVTKRLLRDAGIPIGKFLTYTKSQVDAVNFQDIVNELGLPLFIKPANLGSSVGVHKVKTEDEFKLAIKDAWTYDNKIIIEEFIKGREIECSVLGSEASNRDIQDTLLRRHVARRLLPHR